MSGSTRGEHAAGGGHVAEFFDAGHEQFQALSSALWDPIGRASVAVARPAVGQRVLDACCGAGASAVPTAQAVGHAGAVDAVDLADRLLEEGRAAATEAGLGWIRFVRDDVTRFGEAASYDVVQCVLGVFLLPDMDAGTAHLIRLARPGGRVVVTTWAEGAIEPIRAAVGEVLPEERPELRESLSRPPPADRIQTPEALSSWLAGLGLAEVAVVRAPLRIPFDEGVVSSLFGGTALSGLVAGLDPERRSQVVSRIAQAALRRGRELDATTLIASGTAP